MEALRYGSNRRVGNFTPSFSHVYLRGVAPVARHLSLIVCDAGHALNALFNIPGSENLGAPKQWAKGMHRKLINTLANI